MPLFEFYCEECQAAAELLVGREEKPKCPQCGSRKMEKLMSVSAGRVSNGLSMASACPPPEAGPCSPRCCRLPQ